MSDKISDEREACQCAACKLRHLKSERTVRAGVTATVCPRCGCAGFIKLGINHAR